MSRPFNGDESTLDFFKVGIWRFAERQQIFCRSATRLQNGNLSATPMFMIEIEQLGVATSSSKVWMPSDTMVYCTRTRNDDCQVALFTHIINRPITVGIIFDGAPKLSSIP